MNVLLIFNKDYDKDIKVIVKLGTKSLKDKVRTLLDDNRPQEAFNLIISKAEVREYIPPGTKPNLKPDLTLVEDLL